MKARIVLLVILLFFVIGCGGGINLIKTDLLKSENIRLIKIKVTTKEEIINIFGEPINILNVGEKEQYFYKDENLKSLWIEFDKNGKVCDYIYKKKKSINMTQINAELSFRPLRMSFCPGAQRRGRISFF